MNKKLIVGLGNPGPKYELTRHNAGFMLADALGNRFIKDKTTASLISTEEDYIVAKPLTYMNKSGAAVKALVKKFDLKLDDLLVAYDDFNISRGKIRIRPGGSAGGHNGMQSIIDFMGSKEIPRLRLGIGGLAVKDKVEYVLEKFGKKELKEVKDMVIKAKRLVKYYIDNNIEDTMNKYN